MDPKPSHISASCLLAALPLVALWLAAFAVPPVTAQSPPAPPVTSRGNLATCETFWGNKLVKTPFCRALKDVGGIYWSVTNNTESALVQKVNINILYESEWDGWIGVGLSPNGWMVRSSACIGFRTPDGGPIYVDNYYLGGITRSDIRPPGRLPLTLASGETIGRTIRLNLTIVLVQGDAASQHLVWARGRPPVDPIPGIRIHTVEHSGRINFLTGKFEDNTFAILSIHAAFQTISWGAILPVGAIVARYFHALDPTWFTLHRGFQAFGVLLGLAGYIIGVYITGKLAHTSYPHHFIPATIIMVGSILQFTAIMWRPHLGTSQRVPWNFQHWYIGRFCILLSVPTIWFGLRILSPEIYYYGIVAVWQLLLVLTCLYLEIRDPWKSGRTLFSKKVKAEGAGGEPLGQQQDQQALQMMPKTSQMP